jgi:hypothetical protein
MSDLVTDPNDPRLKRGSDAAPVAQNAAYLVLSEEDRKRGFLLPIRAQYKHLKCGTVTRMSAPIAETYARDPWFYGSTYCVGCQMHRPLEEFTWEPDGTTMTPTKWDDATLQFVAARRAQLGA